jgi:hypothetical protein
MAAPAWQAPKATLGVSVWVQVRKRGQNYPSMDELSDLMNRRKALDETL